MEWRSGEIWDKEGTKREEFAVGLIAGVCGVCGGVAGAFRRRGVQGRNWAGWFEIKRDSVLTSINGFSSPISTAK